MSISLSQLLNLKSGAFRFLPGRYLCVPWPGANCRPHGARGIELWHLDRFVHYFFMIFQSEKQRFLWDYPVLFLWAVPGAESDEIIKDT